MSQINLGSDKSTRIYLGGSIVSSIYLGTLKVWSPCDEPPYFCVTEDLDTSCVSDFSDAWAGCSGLTSFPGGLNFDSGVNFSNAWSGCTNLASFPAGVFDTCPATNFSGAWYNCALDQTSVDNILISLDTAGQTGGILTISGGTSSIPSISGQAAAGSLAAKGWTLTLAGCNKPPYGCNTNVNPYCVTNFSEAWRYCTSLTSFPLLNVSSGTNFSYAWANCSQLASFPGTLDLSSGTNFNFAWQGCTSLTSFPGTLDLSSGTNFRHAWLSCTSLTSFPGTLNLSSGTNFFGAWSGCGSLTSFPALDVSSGTDFGLAWNLCSSLTSFPLLDVSSGTNFGSAWDGCSSLTSFPVLDVSNGGYFGATWSFCTSLTSFPALSFSQGWYFRYSWFGCTNLVSFPPAMFDSCQATNFYEAWYGCALDQTSVDNILISINNAGTSNGTLGIFGGSSAPPSPAGLAAVAALQARGWTVTTN